MILRCPSCEQRNRVPADRFDENPRCGSCGDPLGPVAEPLDVTADEFDELLSATKVPVLIDFWASWCGPCRTAAPYVETTAREMRGRAVVLKVNTDEEPELATRFAVRGIPNFVVIRYGQIVHQQAGLVDAYTMMSWLEQAEPLPV
jgi:thioredoxin 2